MNDIYKELKAIQTGATAAPDDNDRTEALKTIKLYCFTHDCETEKDCKLENLCGMSIADIEKVYCEIKGRW